MITGKDLRRVKRSHDEWDQPCIAFTLNSLGGERFYRFTTKNIGQSLAIVLDKRIQSVATIQEAIPDGRGKIRGYYSIQEADDMVLLLRSGALPASITLIEEKPIE